MNKFVKRFFGVLCLSLAAVSVASCGKKGKKDVIKKDPLTINVRVFAGGFGADWAYDLQEAFETAYEAEGYKMNILTPSSDQRGSKIVQEMYLGYEDTGIDLYITGDVTANAVSALGDYGVLAEDIEELVFNQKAIKYDATEEDKTVGEKILADYIPYLRADNGIMYGFNYAQTSAGLVVNTRKLAKYGITTLPKTTDELFNMFDIIYRGNGTVQNSFKTGTYPITYILGSNGYINCAFDTWFAQLGIDTYNEFYHLQNYNAETGEWIDMADPTQAYANEDLIDVFECAYRIMDPNIAANGSTTQVLDQAQAKIMKDGDDAVFMFNGDWMLNEVKLNYKKQLNDITFINTPVISTVGKKLFGEGTTHNLNDAEADQLLSYVIGLVDESMPINEIITNVQTNKSITLTADEVQTVATARGVVYARGVEHLSFINKGTPKKDICALVLRMMASDDFAETFMETANCTSPYAKELKTQSQYGFTNAAKDIVLNKYTRAIRGQAKGLRATLNIGTFIPQINYTAQHINNQGVSMYTFEGSLDPKKTVDVYRTGAQSLFTTANNNIKTVWQNYLKDKK